MSLTNPNTPVSQQDLQDFYHKILPYMGGSFAMIANKFSKGDLYSTDEKMIGQWIDGKPVYQKILNLGTLSLSSSTTHEDIDISTWNMETMIDCRGGGVAYKGTAHQGNVTFPQNYISDLGLKISIKVSTSGDLLVIYKTISASGTFTLQNTFIIVQYTKTTDSSISIGDDTDYSTEEKIVGTWIDGKPIYQKTVYNTTLSSIPNNNWVTYCTIENIKDLILFKFMRAKNDGGTLGVFNDICGSTNSSNVTCISRTTALTLDNSKSYAIIQYTKTT